VNSTIASPLEPLASDVSGSSLQGSVCESGWIPAETGPAQQGSTEPCPAQLTRRKTVERRRLTVSLPLDLLERSRNTVYWTKGLTLARLLEHALTSSLDQRERMNGQPFPRRLEELKGGRPPNGGR
jgi:hypothetical protein